MGVTMQTEQLTWIAAQGWQTPAQPRIDAGLVLYFGSNEALQGEAWHSQLALLYPNAHLVGCSTGGQIHAADVAGAPDIPAIDESESRSYGEALGRRLLDDDLVAVYVLSEGLQVNGSDLVRGLTSVLGGSVRISGGLAGDGARFLETCVGVDSPPRPMTIAAIGFYGTAVRFGYGCGGGWDTFGVSRRITRSSGNELFELDGKPALDLYERYLGEEAAGLPGTGLPCSTAARPAPARSPCWSVALDGNCSWANESWTRSGQSPTICLPVSRRPAFTPTARLLRTQLPRCADCTIRR
jgi:hypothetical protein